MFTYATSLWRGLLLAGGLLIAGAVGAQETSRPPTLEIGDIRARLVEVIEEARGVAGDWQRIATRVIEAEIVHLGPAAVPVAIEMLEARAAESQALAGLLAGVVRVAGTTDEAVCGVIRETIAEASPSLPDELIWKALHSLRRRQGGCPVTGELAALFRRAHSPDLRLAIVETLGWVGRDRADFLVTQGLARDASDDCERRLLTAAAVRIADRFFGRGADARRGDDR